MAMLSPVIVLNLEVACNFKVQNDHMGPPGHDGSNQKSRVPKKNSTAKQFRFMNFFECFQGRELKQSHFKAMRCYFLAVCAFVFASAFQFSKILRGFISIVNVLIYL